MFPVSFSSAGASPSRIYIAFGQTLSSTRRSSVAHYPQQVRFAISKPPPEHQLPIHPHPSASSSFCPHHSANYSQRPRRTPALIAKPITVIVRDTMPTFDSSRGRRHDRLISCELCKTVRPGLLADRRRGPCSICSRNSTAIAVGAF